jgi:hypothetical protein
METIVIKGFKLTPTSESTYNVFQDFEGEIYDRELEGTAEECVVIATLELLCEGQPGREELYHVLIEHDDHPLFRDWLQDAVKWEGVHILAVIESAQRVAKRIIEEQKVRNCFAMVSGK